MDTKILVRSFLENLDELEQPCVNCEQADYDDGYDSYDGDDYDDYEDDSYDDDDMYTENEDVDVRKEVRNLIESVSSDNDEEMLSEVGTSTIKVTKKRKLKMLTGLSAIRIAKKKEDPLYAKYKKFRGLALKYKAMLVAKNKSKAKRVAMRAFR